MTEVDLDSYGEQNDIGPDDPAPREPEGDPDVTTDAFRVWLFDAEESSTVPDVYVVDKNPLPIDFRMWVFVGRGEKAQFVMRASHKYAEDEFVPGGREDCCEVLFEGASLGEEHCPAEVTQLVTELTDADVSYPETPEKSNHGGPINY